MPFERVEPRRLEPVGVPGRSEPAFGGVDHDLRRAPARPDARAATGSLAQPNGAKICRRSATLDVAARSYAARPSAPALPARTRRRSRRAQPPRAHDEPPARPGAPALLGRRRARGAQAVRRHLRDAEVLHQPDLRAGRRRRRRRPQALRRARPYASSTSRSSRTTTRRKGYNRWMRAVGSPRASRGSFLVGRDGRVKAKFEGSVSARELRRGRGTPALQRCLRPEQESSAIVDELGGREP